MVLLGCAKEQVLGAHAATIVAVVTDKPGSGDKTKSDRVDEPMYIERDATNLGGAVPLTVDVTLPLEALPEMRDDKSPFTAAK